MKEMTRHRRVWRLLQFFAAKFVELKFGFTHENMVSDTPIFIVSNHVSEWDPLLLALSFPKNQLYFVASEHLFRKKFLSKLLNWLVAPIPRRKGASAIDTVMTCKKRIAAGGNVAIFAEGDATWDGITNKVYPATAKLARNSGAALVTYRIEGAYFASPRWGKKARRGKIHGRPINVYPPEKLKAMKPAEIFDIINNDIYENAWERQKEQMVVYKSNAPAENLQTALFICPECGQVGTLSSKGDRIFCSCGFGVRITETGFFDPITPFESVYEWDKWQFERLKNREFVHGDILFGDENLQLTSVEISHEQTVMGCGKLSMTEDALIFGDEKFLLSDITDMSMIRTHLLMFTCGGKYYEIKSAQPVCLRKYLAVWKNTAEKEE